MADITYGEPCYPVTLQPNQTATVTFGNRPAATIATETSPSADLAPDESDVTFSDSGDVAFDESGYDGHEPLSDDVDQPVLDQQLFLPMIQREANGIIHRIQANRACLWLGNKLVGRQTSG